MPALHAIQLVFNAHWSLRGGLAYLADRIRGDEPCELCRITYGGLTKKGEWKACEKDVRAPVEELYRNQLPDGLATLLGETFPAVTARTSDGYVLLLGPTQLAALDGDPLRLHQALLAALDAHHITA